MTDSGIYQIKNEMNGKSYVGSSANAPQRWWQHVCDLRHGRHHNQRLQHAFDKYGESAFVLSILEHVEDSTQLVLREQHYLDTLRPEYNIHPIARSPLGVRRSLETREKMSEARRGKHPSVETRAKISRALQGCIGPNYGKQFSNETRAKMSKAWTPERRQALSERMRGNDFARVSNA